MNRDLTEMSMIAGARQHRVLLAHHNYGVTELRVFGEYPEVAYVDNDDDFVRLCLLKDGDATGIYVGVQPRPPRLFDLAPNCWVPARGGPNGNCARDAVIEYLTTVFFDVDVVSEARRKGHPASEDELRQSLQAAQLLSRQDGLALSSTIACSGNGHYVIAPLVPIPVGDDEVARKFKSFCRQIAEDVGRGAQGVKFDDVYNPSRVMRAIGTLNRKGHPVPGRPHRRAHFVTEPMPARSIALHHMILNTEAEPATQSREHLPVGLRCDLSKIERCEFIEWCRRHPQEVSEPQWFALMSNLAHLRGGIELVHEISALDERYDRADTSRVVERILREGYKPVNCRTIMSPAMARPGRGAFQCFRITACRARAPMYMAALGITQ